MNYKKYFFSYWNYIKNIPKRKMVIYIMVLIIAGGGVFLVAQNIFKADMSSEEPAAPTNLTATDNDAKTQISLSWTDNSSDESGFIIEQTPTFEQDFTQIAQLGPNQMQYTDNISQGHRYYYRVRAYNASGSSIPSLVATPTRTEKTDLILGRGDFETPIVSYNSNAKQSLSGQESNISWSSSNNEIGSAWRSYTDYNIHNQKSLIMRVDQGLGIDGSNAQYMGIKDYNGSSEESELYLTTYLKNYPSNYLVAGNKLVFHLDETELIDSTDLPSGTNVTFRMVLELYAKDAAGNYQTAVTGYHDLVNGQNETSVTIPSNFVSDFVAYSKVVTIVSGDLTGHEPAFRIDGAHLYSKNPSDQYLTWQIPAPQNRAIKTQANLYAMHVVEKGIYWAAQTSDYLSIADADYGYISSLKNINPNIKIYIYEIPAITDARSYDVTRNPKYIDSFFNNSPIGFEWALLNHPNWFTTFPANTAPLEPKGDNRSPSYLRYIQDGPDGTNPADFINYVFSQSYPSEYLAAIGSDYKDAWTEKTKEKLQKYHADGVFSDGPMPQTLSGTYTDPSTGQKNEQLVYKNEAYQTQSFASYVFDHLRQAGFETVNNSAGMHYDGWPGRAYLNPTWDPESETAGRNGVPNNFNPADYQIATRQGTADTFFNEMAFVSIDWRDENMHDANSLKIWLNSLQDMDDVVKWNENITEESLRKHIMQHIIYYDRPDLADPADGPDGEIQFALSSFLLASSEDASLSFEKGIPSETKFGGGVYNQYNQDIDLSITEKLGQPIADRIVETGTYPDKTLQSREFENGLVVANGSPDQSRDFILQRNLVDDLGSVYPRNTQITLLPHTGRIFFTKIDSPVIIPPVTSPPTVNPDTITKTVTDNNQPSDNQTPSIAENKDDTSTSDTNALNETKNNSVISNTKKAILTPIKSALEEKNVFWHSKIIIYSGFFIFVFSLSAIIIRLIMKNRTK